MRSCSVPKYQQFESWRERCCQRVSQRGAFHPLPGDLRVVEFRILTQRTAYLCWALLIATVMPPRVHGDLTVVETEETQGQQITFRMTVTPAAEPVPALKHRLQLREIDLRQGNAAPFYYRALRAAPRAYQATREKFGEEYDQWYRTQLPLHELPLEKLHDAAGSWQAAVMQDLRIAAQRRHCDWEWNLQEMRGPDLIAFHLEEVNESREVARALMLQTRLALAEQRIDDALDLLRLNYRLGRDVAREPLLVCDLVGIAIATMGNREVVELIAQSGSPNLYWALTELPRPLIDIRESLRSEMSLGLRTFPFILDAETADHSPQEWSRLLAKALLEGQMLMDSSPRIPAEQMVLAQAGVTAMSLISYPAAKQRLVTSGMDPQQVARLPVGQIVAIDSLREYRKIADALEKWQYIPYRTLRSREVPDPLENHSPSDVLTHGYGYALAASLLPAITAARAAEQRLVWEIDGLRTLEAIRMHAAQTGELPASLAAIEMVPVPENPATGEPFDYQLQGDMAVLDQPFSDGFRGIAIRYQIRLAN